MTRDSGGMGPVKGVGMEGSGDKRRPSPGPLGAPTQLVHPSGRGPTPRRKLYGG